MYGALVQLYKLANLHFINIFFMRLHLRDKPVHCIGNAESFKHIFKTYPLKFAVITFF